MRDREAVHSRGFNLFLQGFTRFLVGRDDQHVSYRRRFCDFREFRAIDGGSEGWAPLGGVFRTSRFSADEYQEELAEARARGGSGVVSSGERGGRFVARLRFYEAQLWRSRERVAWVTRVLRSETAAHSSWCRSADRQPSGGF